MSLQKLGGEKFGAVQAAIGRTRPCHAERLENSRANGISVILEFNGRGSVSTWWLPRLPWKSFSAKRLKN